MTERRETSWGEMERTETSPRPRVSKDFYRTIILDFLAQPADQFPEAVIRLNDQTFDRSKLHTGLYRTAKSAEFKDRVRVSMRNGEPVLTRTEQSQDD